VNNLSSALSFVNYRGKFNSADAFEEHARITKIFTYGTLSLMRPADFGKILHMNKTRWIQKKIAIWG
jgi:hypothetical protein